jgi:hypothetical protein
LYRYFCGSIPQRTFYIPEPGEDELAHRIAFTDSLSGEQRELRSRRSLQLLRRQAGACSSS